jgi:RNA polymerase sigma factor (TIGR02999 family)
LAQGDEPDITQLLAAWTAGDREALDKLTRIVQIELRRLADLRLRGERKDHTLQPTALVNEAYLRLLNRQSVNWQSRAQFFAIASRTMRDILIDYARSRKAAKRDGAMQRLSLDDVTLKIDNTNIDLLALDEALVRLEAIDTQKKIIVEMRHFGGLTLEEIAEVLGISKATVERHWQIARGWLYRELEPRKD